MLYLVPPSLSLIAMCIWSNSAALTSGIPDDAVGDVAVAPGAAEESWPSIQNMNWFLQSYGLPAERRYGKYLLQLHDQFYAALGINEIGDDSNEFSNNQRQTPLKAAIGGLSNNNNMNISDDDESNSNQADINQINLQDLLKPELEALFNIGDNKSADNSSAQLMNNVQTTLKPATNLLKQSTSAETILSIDGKDINNILIKESADVMKSGMNVISVETTLDKIDDFFDSLDKVITDSAEDSDQTTPRIDEVRLNEETESNEVQGFSYDSLNFNESSSIATASETTASGRARKSKKTQKDDKKQIKMMNWLWPLLIAYKLKFFMLIPIMIAGLTLLVGSTGLAGFFFALFTVVAASRSW